VSLYFHSSFLHLHLFTFNLKYIFSDNFSRILPDFEGHVIDDVRVLLVYSVFSSLGFKGGCFYSGNILLTIIFLINWSRSSSSLTLQIAHSWVSTLSYWDSTLQNNMGISYGSYYMDHIIRNILNKTYEMDHIIWTIWYGPYDIAYVIYYIADI